MFTKYPESVMQAKRRGALWGITMGALLLPALLIAGLLTNLFWPRVIWILGFFILLIPIRFFLAEHLAYVFFQSRVKPSLLWVAAGGCALASALIDVPFTSTALLELSARGFGEITTGTVVSHEIRTSKGTDFNYIRYEHHAGELGGPYRRLQMVDARAFKQLADGQTVSVYYLPLFPTISAISDDRHLKESSLTALSISVWVLLVILLFLGRLYFSRLRFKTPSGLNASQQ